MKSMDFRPEFLALAMQLEALTLRIMAFSSLCHLLFG